MYIGNAQKTIQYEKKTYITGVSSEQDEISVISKDLITLGIKYAFLTSIKKEDIPVIHDSYGPDYIEKVCLPVIRSSARQTIGGYTVEEIFSSKRDVIENEILETSKNILYKHSINLEGLYITNIELPQKIREAMEEKLVTEQEILIRENRIKISKMDSERQRIKAEGTAEYNRILDSSLTEKVLQMKYIEVLSELAKSQNTKIIILDSNKPELPIIIEKNQEE
jgi:prohibitin 1